jgi:hypothetical protein
MRLTLPVLCIVATLSSVLPSALAWQVPVPDANCPAFKPSVGWREYLSGTIPPPLSARYGNVVVVEFNKAKSVNDPDAIGRLVTNLCYQVQYSIKPFPGREKGYWVWRDSGYPPDVKQGLDGDPNKYEINVYGVILNFNDEGFVKDHHGNVVGVLTCTMGDQCKAY